MILSVVTCDFFIGKEIGGKLEGTFTLGKTIVLPGWKSGFYLSIGDLVTISSGALVSTTVTLVICDDLLDVEIDNTIADTWALGKSSFCCK